MLILIIFGVIFFVIVIYFLFSSFSTKAKELSKTNRIKTDIKNNNYDDIIRSVTTFDLGKAISVEDYLICLTTIE